MKKIVELLVSMCIVLFALTGCGMVNRSYAPESPSANILNGDLVTSGYVIADSLIAQLKSDVNKKDSRILVTSFVNINNLRESSTVGRMLSEHVASRLSQRGFNIIELRLRTSSVFMEEGKGEFLLSRDLKEVSKNQNATVVVVGTYGESSKDKVNVSARIVNPSDSTIISSCDYVLAPETSVANFYR